LFSEQHFFLFGEDPLVLAISATIAIFCRLASRQKQGAKCQNEGRDGLLIHFFLVLRCKITKFVLYLRHQTPKNIKNYGKK
jgi:hypothetical protein